MRTYAIPAFWDGEIGEPLAKWVLAWSAPLAGFLAVLMPTRSPEEQPCDQLPPGAPLDDCYDPDGEAVEVLGDGPMRLATVAELEAEIQAADEYAAIPSGIAAALAADRTVDHA